MSDARVSELVERAFAYRGYVTVQRRDGATQVGFIYDRDAAHVDMFDEAAANRVRVPLADIADISLTGEDSAAKAQHIWERRRGALEPREMSRWGEWADRPLLILVALPGELRAIARVVGAEVRGFSARGRMDGFPAVVRAVGCGGGAAYAIAEDRPRLVFSCGFSGALERTLRTGDLVLASSVCDESGQSVIASQQVVRAARDALARKARIAEGQLLCATSVAVTRAEKRALARPGRLAVNLESWAAASAAEQAGIPWLALRVVLDPLDVELPAFTRQQRASYVVPALRHALGGPSAALELARLGLRARTANRALAAAVQRLEPALGQLARATGRT